MINFRNWIYIRIGNPLKTINKLKGVFKPLKRYFRFGWGLWNYHPVLWCSKPSFIHIIFQDVMWKDKYNSPRYEVPPYIWIHIWKFNFIWWWEYSHDILETDEYWEQALWYLFYYNEYRMKFPDLLSAENYWPWQDYKTHKSTWNNRYLI